jgi:hypothetical protein
MQYMVQRKVPGPASNTVLDKVQISRFFRVFYFLIRNSCQNQTLSTM